MLLRGADGQQEEGNREHITHDHHGQVQIIIVAHHAAVEHAQNSQIGSDGQRQLTAAAGNHKPLQRLVVFNDLNIFRDLDLFLLTAAQTKILGVVLFPDADDSQDGQHNRDNNADRGERSVEIGRVVVTHIGSQDRCQELHGTHAGKRADGIEDSEQRSLLGIVGQNRLGRPGYRGLKSIADNPHSVQQNECHIT